jgi:hypothetical protein
MAFETRVISEEFSKQLGIDGSTHPVTLHTAMGHVKETIEQ